MLATVCISDQWMAPMFLGFCVSPLPLHFATEMRFNIVN